MYTSFSTMKRYYDRLRLEEERIKQFLDASFSGNLFLLKQLVEKLGEQQEDIASTVARMTDVRVRNALHLACDRGKLEICQYLIRDLKLDPNITDFEGNTPLVYAYGSLEVGAFLIENGADPNAAIHKYAERRCQSHLRFLLSKGASVNLLVAGRTPLHAAAAAGVKESVEILLENGANPNDPRYILSPLMLSVRSSFECVKMLLKAGADPNINASGETPLHAAVAMRIPGMIRSLLSAKADPNITNDCDLTPLEVAAKIGCEEGVRLLFPVTLRIPYIPIWMPTGVLLYANSTEASEKRVKKLREKAMTSKLKGDEAFKRKEYADAEYWYSKVLREDPQVLPDGFRREEVSISRCLCNAHLKKPELAMQDAGPFRKMPSQEGYYIQAVVCRMMKNFRRAEYLFATALSLDPGNEKLKRYWQECNEEIQRPGGRLTEFSYNTRV